MSLPENSEYPLEPHRFIFIEENAFDEELTKKTFQRRSPYCRNACDLCHLKKRKCEFVDPASKVCSLCVRLGHKTCSYRRQSMFNYQSHRSDFRMPRKKGIRDACATVAIKEEQAPPKVAFNRQQTQSPSFYTMQDTDHNNYYSNYTECRQLMADTRILPPLVPPATYHSPIGVPINPQLPPILLGEQSMLQHNLRLPPLQLLITELDLAKSLQNSVVDGVLN